MTYRKLSTLEKIQQMVKYIGDIYNKYRDIHGAEPVAPYKVAGDVHELVLDNMFELVEVAQDYLKLRDKLTSLEAACARKDDYISAACDSLDGLGVEDDYNKAFFGAREEVGKR